MYSHCRLQLPRKRDLNFGAQLIEAPLALASANNVTSGFVVVVVVVVVVVYPLLVGHWIGHWIDSSI